MMHIRHKYRRGLRRSRAVVASVAAVCLSLIPAFEATAETLTLAPDRTAWFWMSNSKVTTCVTVAGVCGGSGDVEKVSPSRPSPMTPGHLGVAQKQGTDDMRAYMHFDLGDVPAGATVSKFVLTLVVARADDTQHAQAHANAQGRAPTTAHDDVAQIAACPVRTPWADNVKGGGGGDPQYSTQVDSNTGEQTTVKNEPVPDCSVAIPGRRAGDGKTWSFDMTPLAQKWMTGEVFNEGIGLIPIYTGPSATWTVEFHGPALTAPGPNETTLKYVEEKDAARAAVEFVGGPPPPPLLPPPSFSGGGGGVTFPSFGNPIPTDIPQIPTQVFGEVFANAPPPSTPIVPVATSTPTPWGVLTLLPLGLLGLGVLSTMIGSDTLGLAVQTSAGSRVASVLQARRLAGDETSEGLMR